jgi:hypothetical protein
VILSCCHARAGSLNGMGESMPRNANSSHMRQSMLTRQKTSQKRAKLRRMKELYASHLSTGVAGAASGGVESDGNKSASEDELLQVRGVRSVCVRGCCATYFERSALTSERSGARLCRSKRTTARGRRSPPRPTTRSCQRLALP